MVDYERSRFDWRMDRNEEGSIETRWETSDGGVVVHSRWSTLLQ